MAPLFNHTFDVLQHSLNYASLKNKTIANNIANVDTPNYKAKNVVFKDVLSQAQSSTITAKRTHERHLPFSSINTGNIHVQEQRNSNYNHNGNNVDIDKEMTELAKNQIYYDALVDRLNGKFRSIETVINGGK
ncbi:flagellar basal body rod protein FlgB [Salirhabdus salicampi]|uniref:flagellar basal body rod protein FlgB n=1 Tax=Salirhabdus salicampi TaxID=476102 RepID=UPI0020C59D7D|nr:flagellar basal body rod protein FlgB [Salirhabdus salicampi]MCP8616528.1 flagellar basal body rod protein FlgB [Salirhabdus salicampi]